MTYTTKTLAERWRCSKQSILKMIHEGMIKSFKIGTEWRISEKEVIKYEEGNHESMDGDCNTN